MNGREHTNAREGSLATAFDGLITREPIFHRPEFGLTRADFEAQTAVDYWEVGVSGQRYSREYVWSVLSDRYADPEYFVRDEWTVSEFQVRALGNDTFLVTYTLDRLGRVTARHDLAV